MYVCIQPLTSITKAPPCCRYVYIANIPPLMKRMADTVSPLSPLARIYDVLFIILSMASGSYIYTKTNACLNLLMPMWICINSPKGGHTLAHFSETSYCIYIAR